MFHLYQREKHFIPDDIIRKSQFIQLIQSMKEHDPEKSMMAIAKELQMLEWTTRSGEINSCLQRHKKTVLSIPTG